MGRLTRETSVSEIQAKLQPPIRIGIVRSWLITSTTPDCRIVIAGPSVQRAESFAMRFEDRARGVYGNVSYEELPHNSLQGMQSCAEG